MKRLNELSKIEQITPLTSQSMLDLTSLYYPLMNREAVVLYVLLTSLDQHSLHQDMLLRMSGMNQTAFVNARKFLEQFQLLKTYQTEGNWLYHLYAPLNAKQFFAHDTFSRLFLEVVGSQRFDAVKLLLQEKTVPENMQDVSETLNLSRLASWNDAKEKVYLQRKNDANDYLKKYRFDFNAFFVGMDRIFPLRMRSKETLSRIGQLADIHGISPEDMRKYVNRSINPSTYYFDWDKLKSYVYGNQTKVEKVDDIYQLAPVQFMMHMQNNAPVAPSDRALIEKLCNEYHFSNEVANVLIEYTLKHTNQEFPKSFVEKVAASWVRKGIDTKEKALKAINGSHTKPKSPSKKNTSYPEWYTKTEQHEASSELTKEVNQMLENLDRGNYGK